MYLSLASLASCLPNGRVKGNKVVCTGPESVNHRNKWKRKRHTLTVYINGQDIGVNCHHPDQDWKACNDWVRAQAGLPAWKPARKRTKGQKADPVSFEVRNRYFGETLRVLRYRDEATVEQFKLLINDLRPKDAYGKTAALCYAAEFGIGPADVERIMAIKPKNYSADERAAILNVPYAERMHLALRHTGAIDVDKVERERLRRERANAAKRAKRAADRPFRLRELGRLEALWYREKLKKFRRHSPPNRRRQFFMASVDLIQV